MVATLERLADVLSQIPDPRKARGVRRPFSSILSLVFLGLLARVAITSSRSKTTSPTYSMR